MVNKWARKWGWKDGMNEEVPSSEANHSLFLCVVNKWARKWGWKDGMNE